VIGELDAVKLLMPKAGWFGSPVSNPIPGLP